MILNTTKVTVIGSESQVFEFLARLRGEEGAGILNLDQMEIFLIEPADARATATLFFDGLARAPARTDPGDDPR